MSAPLAPAADPYSDEARAAAAAYARQFFDLARKGDLEAFRGPLQAGLPPNITNEKVRTSTGSKWKCV